MKTSRGHDAGRGVASCLALAGIVLAGCHAGDAPKQAAPPPSAAPAGPATSPGAARAPAAGEAAFDLAACLQPGAAPANCPAFIVAAVADAAAQCSEQGGKLLPSSQPDITAVDVDGDGRPEYLFDVTGNVTCDTAPSLLGCGSSGCPFGLYREQDGDWSLIGSINAEDEPELEVMPRAAGQVFADLRGGCVGQRPCNQLDIYRWDGQRYDIARIEVRGHAVTPGPGTLYTLKRTVAVLAEPAAGAAVLQTYEPGSIFAIVGKADGTDYLYVSPCQACESGFVLPDALRD